MASRKRAARTPPCPVGVEKESMKGISAPYNFVPLPDWLYIPDYGQYVSHDKPFKEGLSGEITFTLKAISPLLVGGEHSQDNAKDADKNVAGTVRPFKLPDDRYAIPGSGLKGMLRSVVEAAGFGRMKFVDDVRPGIRDVTGRFVQSSYKNKFEKAKPETGLLSLRDNDEFVITPCKMARISHRLLEKEFGIDKKPGYRDSKGNIQKPIFSYQQHKSVSDKYKYWTMLCKQHKCDPATLHVDINSDEVRSLSGNVEAMPVFTGQISDSKNDRGKQKGKYKDFVFYNPNPEERFVVEQNEWRDFLDIHGDEQPDGAQGSWPGHWRAIFRQRGEVPVFYTRDRGLLRIGLAYMPKLAGDYSVHELLKSHGKESFNFLGDTENSNKDNGGGSGYDLADLLFGSVDSNNEKLTLKGRVSIETAVCSSKDVPKTQHPETILNGPKPSYFPNYIKQPSDPKKGTLTGNDYATYMDTGNGKPMLRGRKRYPAKEKTNLVDHSATTDSRKTQVVLHTLNPGVEFSGRIVVHNLLPEELGALLWAMTWGGDETLVHGLGMGKPFGFGQVRFCDLKGELTPNQWDRDSESIDAEKVQQYMQQFKDSMEDVAKTEKNGGWEDSEVICNLLAMADPEAAELLPDDVQLRYMYLILSCMRDGKRANVNEYVWAKQEKNAQNVPLVLVDYAAATGKDVLLKEAASSAREKRLQEQEEKKLADALKGLTPDAAEFKQLTLANDLSDNGLFVQAVIDFLEGREQLSPTALELIGGEISKRFPKLMENPHLKRGKKQKAVFSEKQIFMIERIQAIIALGA